MFHKLQKIIDNLRIQNSNQLTIMHDQEELIEIMIEVLPLIPVEALELGHIWQPSPDAILKIKRAKNAVAFYNEHVRDL